METLPRGDFEQLCYNLRPLESLFTAILVPRTDSAEYFRRSYLLCRTVRVIMVKMFVLIEKDSNNIFMPSSWDQPSLHIGKD